MKGKLFVSVVVLAGVGNICVSEVQRAKPVLTEDRTLSDLVVSKDVSTDLKIRFIDSFEVMGTSKEGLRAKQELEKKRETLSKEIQKEEQQITQTMSEYKSKSTTLNDDAREKEEQKLVKMERNYKIKVQESEEALKIDMQKKTESLARGVDEAVIKVAQKENLDAVVDKMTGRVIFVNDQFNYTTQVKNAMDKQYEVKLAQNKGNLDSKRDLIGQNAAMTNVDTTRTSVT